jgi:hypothetical protein
MRGGYERLRLGFTEAEMNSLVLGIDATNLRMGGGRHNLIQLLREATPELNGFCQIVVWGSQQTLDLLEDRPL